jgi:hypothetical protein
VLHPLPSSDKDHDCGFLASLALYFEKAIVTCKRARANTAGDALEYRKELQFSCIYKSISNKIDHWTDWRLDCNRFKTAFT